MKPPRVSWAVSPRPSAAHRGRPTSLYDPFARAAAFEWLAVVTGLVHADEAAHTRAHRVLLARALPLDLQVLTCESEAASLDGESKVRCCGCEP